MTELLQQYNLLGLCIGMCTFLIIGLFHPIVIKCEYRFGTGCWWWFLLLAFVCLALSMLTADIFLQSLLGVTAFSSLWTIKELFDQKERVKKGWFPANPKRQSTKLDIPIQP